MQAAERWLNQSGRIPEEMLQLGTYLREIALSRWLQHR